MSTEAVDTLISTRGAATPQELGLTPAQVLKLAEKRPDLEPVFLVRFRSRQGKVRVEEVRAFAWPSQQLALSHLGYKAEDQRLLRLEPRQPVPFPQRLYATFQGKPKLLEELRDLEKKYMKGIKQAPSKPGRAEMDIVPLQNAFKKLGDDVCMEMWIDAASTFQRFDNPTYASKMLGHLLKFAASNKKVDPSVLARTVLSAADDGVFNAKLYEHTWDLLQKRLGIETSLGFGLRVFRRLITSGRALPTDFVKDMRRAAEKANVADLDALWDSTVVWAAGQASFWNTSKKTASWRDSVTEDHKETELLRARLVELWTEAGTKGDDGERWKATQWERIRAVNAELTAYGRIIVVEKLLAAAPSTRADAERLLEAALTVLAKPPRDSDRQRVEVAANRALEEIGRISSELFWEKAATIEEGLRSAGGNLTSFVALCDLLTDVGERIGERGGETFLSSLPGRTPAWLGALQTALVAFEPKESTNDDDYYDDDDDGKVKAEVPLIGEALSLVKHDRAAEELAEIGPLLASRLARDLEGDDSLEAWERVLGTILALGPVGKGIAATASERFAKSAGDSAQLGNAAPVVHLLDGEVMRPAAESRLILDEAAAEAVSVCLKPAARYPIAGPAKELEHEHHKMPALARRPGGGFYILWSSNESSWDDEPQRIALTEVTPDGKMTVLGSCKPDAGEVNLWRMSDGTVKVVSLKDKLFQVHEGENLKVAKKVSLPDEIQGYSRTMDARRDQILVGGGSHAVVLGADLKPIGEYTSNLTYGSWAFLPAWKGEQAVVVQTQYGESVIFPEPGKKAPPLKTPGFERLKHVARTEDGRWHVEFTKKKGGAGRARLQGDTWVFGEATPLDQPVVDVVFQDDDCRRVYGGESIGYFESRELKNWAGDTLLTLAENDVSAVDLEGGLLLVSDAIEHHPSLPARVQATPLFAQAITKTPGDALPRAAYTDHRALVRYLRDGLASRPAGAQALGLLGDAAGELLDAIAYELKGRLEARARLLDALAAPPPPPRSVPPRKPGVSRTEIRRAARVGLTNDGGLGFWALDSGDPAPLVESLVPTGKPARSDAWTTAATLLGMAQDTKVSPGLASRALDAAEAIAQALARPGNRFALDAVSEANRSPSGRSLSSSGWVWPTVGKYPKKLSPVPLSDDAMERQQGILAWVRESLLAGLTVREVKVVAGEGGTDSRNLLLDDEYEEVRCYEATVVHQGSELTLVFYINLRDKGLEWWFDGVRGEASREAWESLFVSLEESFRRCEWEKPGFVWPAVGIRDRDLEALRKGVGVTRAFLDRREALEPRAWTPPPIKNLDERESRAVTLAWIVGKASEEMLKTNSKGLEAIAKKASKLVSKEWSGLVPARDGKTGDELKLGMEFELVRAASLIAAENDRTIVLAPPEELIAAFLAEAKPALGAGGGGEDEEEAPKKKGKKR
jgi:hypothetical protein